MWLFSMKMCLQFELCWKAWGILLSPGMTAGSVTSYIRNEDGHLVDIHSCSFDEEHNNIYGVEYTWEAFQG